MMRHQQKTAEERPNLDRHGMSDILNKYIDSLITDGKRNVIDERNNTVTNLTNDWNKSLSELIGKRNTEMDTLRKNMPGTSTSFTTGAGLTAGGYGLGRLAALSKRIGRARGNKAGLIGAGLTAGGVMLKDRLFPRQVSLPSSVPSQWVDPSAPQTPTPDPTMWQMLKNLVLPQKAPESKKWVTDKKYPSVIPGGTEKPQPAPTKQSAPSAKPAPNKAASLPSLTVPAPAHRLTALATLARNDRRNLHLPELPARRFP